MSTYPLGGTDQRRDVEQSVSGGDANGRRGSSCSPSVRPFRLLPVTSSSACGCGTTRKSGAAASCGAALDSVPQRRGTSFSSLATSSSVCCCSTTRRSWQRHRVAWIRWWHIVADLILLSGMQQRPRSGCLLFGVRQQPKSGYPLSGGSDLASAFFFNYFVAAVRVSTAATIQVFCGGGLTSAIFVIYF